MDTLSEIVVKLAKLAIEKRLRSELDGVAPELPKEVREDIYKMLFRPAMINGIKVVREAIEHCRRSAE